MLSVLCRDNAVLSIFVLETGKDRLLEALLDQLLDQQKAEAASRWNGQNK
jgi:hypothetical protein